MRAALALGSGGARGYAHIGAIQVLEERGFEIVSVAGSSMGALVGGLYAAGTLDEYAEWVQSLSQLGQYYTLPFTNTLAAEPQESPFLSRDRNFFAEF